MIFNMTGGGAPLNFKVVPNPQPDTAKENTIWVDTDRINNYYFSATQPENMVNYDVWFRVGTSSSVEFNALKKNGIQVYPLSAKQYVSGALVDVTAKTYKDGALVEWMLYLYNAGDQCNSITGGWGSSGYIDSGGATVSGTLNANNMTISRTNDDRLHVLGTKDLIDFSGCKTLFVTVESATNINAWCTVIISTSKNNWTQSPARISKTEITKTGDMAIDISSINSGYLSINANEGRGTAKIKKIWMQ